MPGLWAIWLEHHASSKFSANSDRKEEKKKNMARRKLSVEEQLVGVKAALKSPRTPPQLRAGLKRRKEALERTLGKASGETRKRQSRSFLENLMQF